MSALDALPGSHSAEHLQPTLQNVLQGDMGPEPAFDRLAALVGHVLGSPIVLIALVDAQHLWFKSALGLDLSQMDPARVFCQHMLSAPEPLVVPETRTHPQFSSNALVMGAPFLRFYAGVPLQAPGGQVLGTLCIMDQTPRPAFGAEDLRTLQDLAETVVRELELRRALQVTQHALQQQRRSEALGTAMLNAALDGVVTMDSQGRVLEWNAAAEQIFGYRRQEVLGQELAGLIVPPDAREAHRRGLAHYLRTRHGPVLGRRIEVQALRRDGELFPCELAITPVESGEELLFTAHLRDLTERRAAEAALHDSHALLRAVVDTVPEAIFVKDRQERYVMINAAGAGLIGRPADEILGHTDQELFPAATALHSGQQDRLVLDTGQTAQYEVTDQLTDGRVRSFLSTKSAYHDAQGEVRGLIGSAIDLTDRKALAAQLEEQNAQLAAHVQARTQELEAAQLEMLERLARAAEHRDEDTGEHVHRVARAAAGIASQLGLGPETVALLERAAPLHDVGKIGVPDAILLKPGRLTPEEFDIVKTHTTIGASLLDDSRSVLMQAAQTIALTHHERWDGAGYPQGLRGEAIPLLGRIVAVADVYDALTSERPYKRAWTHEAAVAELRAQAGRQFDPQVVAAFEGWQASESERSEA
ncbi:PAS domain S-box protein [Deinococcus aquaedulcis]|uniref:PAS domain S-box protein n=1 Tax=Deinococcus aquaedulcis TaxID=2840455 RepID=UPI001F326DA7|nr:PAS domain S-box protein [Deinococcus aquaedulcis]